MGCYIETGAAKNKAKWLVEHAGGTIVPRATPAHDSIPVVVCDNGPFEAAGIAFDAEELRAFTDPFDCRPKTIVMVPRDKVTELCPAVKDRLDWEHKQQTTNKE